MRTLTAWMTLVFASCAIVAAGRLLAWYTPDSLGYTLYSAGPGSATGKNPIALPYIREAGVNTALELMRDIEGGVATPQGPVMNISRFLKATDSFAVCAKHGNACAISNPALVSGEGQFVNVAFNVTYVIEGAHDPSLALQLDAAQPGVSKSGKNFIALPYTAEAANAFELMEDIGGGDITPVKSVSRFNAANDTYQVYTGRMGSPVGLPFPLQPGVAYFVAMETSVPYTPSHF